MAGARGDWAELQGEKKVTEPAATFSPRMVDALVDAVFIVEDQGRVLYANPALGQLLGWSIERLFGEMPEAGSGESKFTLRMPDSLRERLAERAKANNQSLNAWMVRCLESCANVPPMTGLTGSNREGWRTKGPSD